MPIAGVLIGAVLEGSRFLDFRLELATRDYKRVWSLCVVGFFSALIYAYNAGGGIHGIYLFTQWLPLVFFPIMMAQAYGYCNAIDATVFSVLIAPASPKSGSKEPLAINISYPYFALALISSSAANNRMPLFFAGLTILAGWALWSVRPRSGSPFAWLALFGAIAITAYAGGRGLERAQVVVIDTVGNWYLEQLHNNPNPLKMRTHIGQIGSMKLSGKILFRVQREKRGFGTLYLPQTIFNTYRKETWLVSHAPFASVPFQSDGKSWNLRRTGQPEEKLTIISTFDMDGGLVLGGPIALRLIGLPAEEVFVNRLGEVKVIGAPGFGQFEIQTAETGAVLSPPDEDDLARPEELAGVFDAFLKEAGLTKASPEEIVTGLERHFTTRFAYTLEQTGVSDGRPPLEQFLTTSRSGHCEYFATATTLLLRHAGIPARYVVGFVASDPSWLERAILVRSRDAHAWAVAYVGGAWRFVDTTPPSWHSVDAKEGSPFEVVADFWSLIVRIFNQLRWSGDSWRTPLAVVVFILAAILVMCLLKGAKRARLGNISSGTGPYYEKQGGDSPYYRIESELRKNGLARKESETPREWIKRLCDIKRPAFQDVKLGEIADMHYRLRFDPDGFNEQNRQALASSVTEWIHAYNSELEKGILD
jgi:hypothetical protein